MARGAAADTSVAKTKAVVKIAAEAVAKPAVAKPVAKPVATPVAKPKAKGMPAARDTPQLQPPAADEVPESILVPDAPKPTPSKKPMAQAQVAFHKKSIQKTIIDSKLVR